MSVSIHFRTDHCRTLHYFKYQIYDRATSYSEQGVRISESRTFKISKGEHFGTIAAEHVRKARQLKSKEKSFWKAFK